MPNEDPIIFEHIRVASTTKVDSFDKLEMPQSAFPNSAGAMRKSEDLDEINKMGEDSAIRFLAAFSDQKTS